jgi:UDP-N-acetylmuramoyl-tripeptide--D-alanyl-D-alanine ligase
MTIQQLLYLAQLEQYDRERIVEWLHMNPGQVVYEKKHALVWTSKVRLLFAISWIYSLFLSKEKAVLLALLALEPFDLLLKGLVYSVAWIKLRLMHSQLRVIGVAGSWGKTTTKETLAEILRSKWRVSVTEGNTNTVMGIAITVLRLPVHTEVFICEMDAWYPGEIATVCRLIRPEVGIVTAIGPQHLERFNNDMEALRKAQMELPQAVPQTGFVYVAQEGLENLGVSADVYEQIAKRFEVNVEVVKRVLANPPAVEHRAQIMNTPGVIVIDDAYNSNPAGFRRALKKLDNTKAKKKILVTPGMIELGARQFEENRLAALEAAKICDVVIVVGQTNKDALMQGAAKTKQLIWVKDLDAATVELGKLATKDSAVLFENDLPDQYF